MKYIIFGLAIAYTAMASAVTLNIQTDNFPADQNARIHVQGQANKGFMVDLKPNETIKREADFKIAEIGVIYKDPSFPTTNETYYCDAPKGNAPLTDVDFTGRTVKVSYKDQRFSCKVE